jgi:hypothetical protein
MKPTPAETENGSPRHASAKAPPVAAIGTASEIRAARRSDWNVLKRSRKIMASASGTTIMSRCEAVCRCSNWPPQRIR